MTLRHLRIFIMVCECNSVTKAAQQLFMSQPAVSLAIHELEEQYGVLLFDRIARKLYITDAGQRCLTYARHIISLFDEMEQSLRDHSSQGNLRIGASVTVGTYLIPQLVHDFQMDHPDTSIQMVIDKSDVIEKKVLENVVDFALIEGFKHYPQLTEETFYDDQLVAVCALTHPLAACAEVSLEQFTSCKFLLREHGSGTRELIDSTMLTHGIILSPLWESISTDTIANAVALNLGVSILPEHLIAQRIENKQLHILHLSNIHFKRSFRIICHQSKYLSATAQAFLTRCRALQS